VVSGVILWKGVQGRAKLDSKAASTRPGLVGEVSPNFDRLAIMDESLPFLQVDIPFLLAVCSLMEAAYRPVFLIVTGRII